MNLQMYKLSKSKIDAKELKNRENAFDILKGIDTLGSYDFFNSIISLDSIESKETRKLFESISINRNSEESYLISKNILPLAFHEYKHHIDATSTYWGINHLKLMQEAYSVEYRSPGSEPLFYKAVNFHDHIIRIRLPKYYTVINDEAESYSIDIQRNTMGLLFSKDGHLSNKAVIFSNYFSKQGVFLSRSPLSMLSLLEASAMAEEIRAQMRLLENIDDVAVKKIAFTLFEEELNKYYNNNKLTEYSVCPRFIKIKFPYLSIKDSYFIAEQIIRICLNTSEKTFNRISNRFAFNSHLNNNSIEERRRIIQAIKNKDRCVLFFLIYYLIPGNFKLSFDNSHTAIYLALEKLGILNEWKIDCLEESQRNFKEIQNGSNPLIKSLAIAGLDNLTKNISIENPIDYYELNLPPCLLSDQIEWSPFFNEKSNLDVTCDDIFNSLFPCESAVKNFVAACTI